MSPFSEYLRRLRQARQKRLKTLAYELNVTSPYLSGLESGKKLPPRNDEFFLNIKLALGLSQEEISTLRSLAIASAKLGPLVQGASSLQAALAMHFADHLVNLRPSQIRAIEAILEMTKEGRVLAADASPTENKEKIMTSR